MQIADLKMYLRLDFDTKIRPIFIKERCEHCGQETELHLHHNNKYFSTLLNETLTELNLSSTEEFTKEQARIIKYVMRGKQLSIDYLTLCRECHIEIHKKVYKKNDSRFKRKKEKELQKKEKELKELQKKIKELKEYLETLVGKKLFKDDQIELANKIGSKVNGRLQKSYSKLNIGLEMLKLPFIILPKRTNKERYWIIKKAEEYN